MASASENNGHDTTMIFMFAGGNPTCKMPGCQNSRFEGSEYCSKTCKRKASLGGSAQNHSRGYSTGGYMPGGGGGAYEDGGYMLGGGGGAAAYGGGYTPSPVGAAPPGDGGVIPVGGFAGSTCAVHGCMKPVFIDAKTGRPSRTCSRTCQRAMQQQFSPPPPQRYQPHQPQPYQPQPQVHPQSHQPQPHQPQPHQPQSQVHQPQPQVQPQPQQPQPQVQPQPHQPQPQVQPQPHQPQLHQPQPQAQPQPQVQPRPHPQPQVQPQPHQPQPQVQPQPHQPQPQQSQLCVICKTSPVYRDGTIVSQYCVPCFERTFNQHQPNPKPHPHPQPQPPPPPTQPQPGPQPIAAPSMMCQMVQCPNRAYIDPNTQTVFEYCSEDHQMACYQNPQYIDPRRARQRGPPMPHPPIAPVSPYQTPGVCILRGCYARVAVDPQSGREHKFCSRGHITNDEAQLKPKDPSRPPTPPPTPVPTYQEPGICIIKKCGKPGYVDPHTGERSQFCSHKCRSLGGNSKNVKDEVDATKGFFRENGVCIRHRCKKPTQKPEHVFCSKKCRDKKNGRLKPPAPGEPDIPTFWDVSRGVAGAQVRLDSGSQEFKNVETKFKNSSPNKTIQNIFRIQNIELYTLFQNYCRGKDKHNKTNPNNVRQVFHGCPPTVVDDIISKGFDRSFVGDNAGAAYGRGVYYARDSSYSASPGYSKPDGKGIQRMFLVDAYTGQYTKGSSGMKVAPDRPGLNKVPYDCVVDNVGNPSIFVVFKDYATYPSYLIEFK